MGLSFTHILIVLVVVLIIFGAGKLPHIMGGPLFALRSDKLTSPRA